MTKIQWTDKTWNPIVGCSVSTPGCKNCYAMEMAARLGTMPNMPRYHGLTKKVNGNAVWTGEVRLVESVLMQPLKRKKPTMYFVNSMGDLFHESVPDEWIDRVFAVMALCPQHTFQVLTKRADRMLEYMEAFNNEGYRLVAAWDKIGQRGGAVWPMPNVWLGVSVEDQTRADERIPLLLDTPAAVRFVSAEPLLGPVDFSRFDVEWVEYFPLGAPINIEFGEGESAGPKIDWVIVGGESGPNARPMHPEWARSLRDQCAEAGVPFFFKQWGEWGPDDFLDGPQPDAWMSPDGSIFHDGIADVYKSDCQKPCSLIVRLGAKAAGNLLDGELWQQMPEARE